MSTGRRLAKRSIIGTKVCAPGPDGLWYSGVIQDVKSPATATVTSSSASSISSSSSSTSSLPPDTGTNFTADIKYIVRFDFKTQTLQNMDTSSAIGNSKSVIMDARRAVANIHISPAQTLRRNAMIKEFRESDLIGPGFRSILGIQLQPGQRVFLTYNGRETSGDVVTHDANKDEVTVKITTIGNEEPIELKKRLEEVRLLESRRSARLADQDRDTDFARLADMGGDRRRTSHSIEVPMSLTPQQNSRKRPPSYTHDCTGDQCSEVEMNECNAARILMELSNSPKSPKNAEKWLGSSPGSSSASWSSGSSSPPLSDDGHALQTSVMLHDISASARIRTTSVSTSDEGIVVDFKEDTPRKKRVAKSKFLCTWKGCNFIEQTPPKIERHIRNVHLGIKKVRRSADYDGSFSESDHEEEFYYTEIEDDDDDGKTPSPTSPPTLSHRDMARPPHEDPEYQRQIVGNFKQGRNINQQHHSNAKIIHATTYISGNNHQQNSINSNCVSASPLAHHNYTWTSNTTASTAGSSATSPTAQSTQLKIISSPRPSHSSAPYPIQTYVQHHHNFGNSPSTSSGSNSSNNNSPIIHSNTSANNVLQQLSQQNVTVTAHHNPNRGNSHQQLHHQLSAVTITPNYHLHNQNIRTQQHASAAANTSVTSSNHQAPHVQHHLQQHAAVQHAVATAKHTPNSPNRRTRGENKKCRKVYGMDRRDQWCTQCRWKKACSRFGD